MKSVSYFVHGRPIGQARARATNKGGFARIHSDPESGSARQEHIAAFNAATRGVISAPHEGPVTCEITLFHQVPQKWWSGKNCTRKPDVDNVAKLVLDALNAVAYRDDSQVNDLVVSKGWADSEALQAHGLDPRTHGEGVLVRLYLKDPVEKPKTARGKKSA